MILTPSQCRLKPVRSLTYGFKRIRSVSGQLILHTLVQEFSSLELMKEGKMCRYIAFNSLGHTRTRTRKKFQSLHE